VRSRPIGLRRLCRCSCPALPLLNVFFAPYSSLLQLLVAGSSSPTLFHLILDRPAATPLHLSTANRHPLVIGVFLSRRAQDDEVGKLGGTLSSWRTRWRRSSLPSYLVRSWLTRVH